MKSWEEPYNFKAPFLPPDKIEIIVNRFLQKYWQQNIIPVDIYKIAEYGLGLEIIPVSNLFRTSGVEAFLLGDGASVHIDFEQFNNDYYENRLRFSVAHEIGHKVLHENLYNRTGTETLDNFIQLFAAIPEREYNWIEIQANQFAGRLLVPTNKLVEEINSNTELIELIIQAHKEGLEEDQIAEFYAHHLNRTFKVSEDVMTIRLKSTGIIGALIQ
jgi:hypothetical protein